MSFEEIKQEFAGQWVAVKGDEVISVGSDPEVIVTGLDYLGVTDYEVFDCPEEPIL